MAAFRLTSTTGLQLSGAACHFFHALERLVWRLEVRVPSLGGDDGGVETGGRSAHGGLNSASSAAVAYFEAALTAVAGEGCPADGPTAGGGPPPDAGRSNRSNFALGEQKRPPRPADTTRAPLN